MLYFVVFIFLAVTASLLEALPVKSEAEAVDYLKHYQYIGRLSPLKEMANLMDEVAFPKGLKIFQRKMGLEVTGILDNATLAMMNKPRCGLPDITSPGDHMKRRRKRYLLQGSKWASDVIWYKFWNYSPDLSQYTIERVVQQAFARWAEVTPLLFVQKNIFEDVHIAITFATGYHGDDYPFDGPGNTLAHAFFPIYGGDVHFDDDEYFTDSSFIGIHLEQVALHEFGHSLGLEHSEVPDAVMFPVYHENLPYLQLHSDDIMGIQALYGAPTTTTTTTTTTPPPVDFCRDAKVDAICENGQGDLIVFQRNWYTLVDPYSGIKSGYPRLISDTFYKLPDNLDAAFYDRPFLFMFKTSQVWRYEYTDGGYKLSYGYPEYLSYFGLPSYIDLAFKWTGNGALYMIKGDNYYKVDSAVINVKEGYPRNTSEWQLNNITTTLTDAFSFGIRTFFVAGDVYYRYNDVLLEVDPDYPKSVSRMWFGCDGGEMEMNLDQTQQTTVLPWRGGAGSLSPRSLSMLMLIGWIVSCPYTC